jgi:hypothetical protein
MKVKRTYRLRPSTVEAVREMVEGRRVAPTQDAVVEMAIEDLVLALRLADEAEQYAAAASDPTLRMEAKTLDRDFAPLDAETWPE